MVRPLYRFGSISSDFLREKLYKTPISLGKQYVKYREIVFPVKCKPICHVLRPIEGFSAKNMDAGKASALCVRIPLHFLQIRSES